MNNFITPNLIINFHFVRMQELSKKYKLLQIYHFYMEY